MKKYTKEELYKMDAVDIYKMVLKGDKIKTFPNGFWKQPEAKQNAAKCTKFLIEEILRYDSELIKEKNSSSLYRQNKLSGMLSICFYNSPYDVINNAYPNEFKEWEFKNVSLGFWENKDNGVRATKWLIEEKLKLSNEELKEKLSANLFTDNSLGGMLVYCFNGSPYEAINTTYPNKFKEWEFKNTPNEYWNIDNRINATKWLIEEHLQLTDEELKENLSQNLFKDNNLGSLLRNQFNGSPYEAINSAYPNKFKKEDFTNYYNRLSKKEKESLKL